MKKIVATLRKELESGDRRALAKAITLVESTRAEDRLAAQELLQTLEIPPARFRMVAMSGPPGVGKSSLIEKLGMELIARGKKVAVLAVDPSSPISLGSILGDKTRMDALSHHPAAFVRPSPSGFAGGGVHARTREASLLCAAAGYDWIFIETVGVGQSEYRVATMVDLFVLVAQPGAGDELQGIKKGILELADLIVINKADGAQEQLAQQTKVEHEKAMHYQASDERSPAVILCSAHTGLGVSQVADALIAEATLERRAHQAEEWLRESAFDFVRTQIEKLWSSDTELAQLRSQVRTHTLHPLQALSSMVDLLKKRL